MNLFWAAVRNVPAARHFESLHSFKNLPPCAKAAACFYQREVDFSDTHVESFPLREIRHDVSLRPFAAPTALRPARFKKRGGHAHLRRCACWRRFPSDCRIETHSDMSTSVLCRNFASG